MLSSRLGTLFNRKARTGTLRAFLQFSCARVLSPHITLDPQD